jgi:hypothetical protein
MTRTNTTEGRTMTKKLAKLIDRGYEAESRGDLAEAARLYGWAQEEATVGSEAWEIAREARRRVEG